jgi:hypothetical protein
VFVGNVERSTKSCLSLESNSLSKQSQSVKEVDPTLGVGNAHIALKLQAALRVLLGIIAKQIQCKLSQLSRI